MSADPEIIISQVISSEDIFTSGASHRDVMIAQGLVPEKASEDVTKSIYLAHEANTLHERISSLYQRAQQEVGGKLRELDTKEVNQISRLHERIELFGDSTTPFERLAISADIPFYNLKRAEGHRHSQEQ